MSYLPEKYSTSFMDVILGTLGAFFLLLIIISTNRRGEQEEGTKLPAHMLTIQITDKNFKFLRFGDDIGYFVGLIDSDGKLTDVHYSDVYTDPETDVDKKLKVTELTNFHGSLILKVETSKENQDKIVVGLWLRDLPPEFFSVAQNRDLMKKMFEPGIKCVCSYRKNTTIYLKKPNKPDECQTPFFCVCRPGGNEITNQQYAEFLNEKQKGYVYCPPKISEDFPVTLTTQSFISNQNDMDSWTVQYKGDKQRSLCDNPEPVELSPVELITNREMNHQNVNICFSEKVHKLITDDHLTSDECPAFSPKYIICDLLRKLKPLKLKGAYLGSRALTLVLEDGSICYHVIHCEHSTYPYRWKKILPSPNDGAEAQWETIPEKDVRELKNKYQYLGDNFAFALAEILAEPMPEHGSEEKALPFRRNPCIDLWSNLSIPNTEPQSQSAQAK